MLKILLITELHEDPPKIPLGKIVASVAPGKQALEALSKYKPDLIVTSLQSAMALNLALQKSINTPRTNIRANTHQGIQLVPVTEVDYFQAEHKYVIAHHSEGELLIEDSMSSLEQEFANDFIRIHRKTIVALAKIEKLVKDAAGKHYIKLRAQELELPVSRRQLPKVRKILLCN
jgi:DNA-binding LytR/AlgR family response regulator